MPTLAETQAGSLADGHGVRWFAASSPAESAMAIASIIARLEQQGAARRRRWLKAAYMVNGVEVPQTFAYSMRAPFGGTGAPIDVNLYEEPYFNLTAQAVDVLSNRIGKNRPWPLFLPQGGDYRTRMRCKKLTRYVDALFAEMDVYREVAACFKDALTYGISFLKIFERPGKRIGLARRLCDEIFVDASEVRGGRLPKNMYDRGWFALEDALAMFPDSKDQEAILRAPRATSGVLYSTGQSDYVALLEAYHLPSLNDKGEYVGGKRVLCVGDHVLEEEELKVPRFPFAIIRYDACTSSFYAKSVFDQVVSVQREINNSVTVFREAHRRFAFPRTLSHQNDGTTEKDYANIIASVIKWKGQTAPQFVSPTAMQPEMYGWLKDSIARGFQRVGISEQAAGGIKQPGLEAAVALRTWNQIEDARHVQLGQALEDFVGDIAIRVLDVARVVKPIVKLRGYRDLQIKWDEVEIPANQLVEKVFPISHLPQLPEGRLQTINDWYQAGQITRAQKMRLEDMPDLDAFTNIADASADWVDWALDTMIESGNYQAPEWYCDLASALVTAQGRYLHEATLGLPDDRLDLLRTFIDQVKDMQAINDNNAATTPAAAPAPAQSAPAPAPSDAGQQGMAA